MAKYIRKSGRIDTRRIGKHTCRSYHSYSSDKLPGVKLFRAANDILRSPKPHLCSLLRVICIAAKAQYRIFATRLLGWRPRTEDYAKICSCFCIGNARRGYLSARNRKASWHQLSIGTLERIPG